MYATQIYQQYCGCQLSEVGQTSDGVAIRFTDRKPFVVSKFNCKKLVLILALHSVSLMITERIQAILIL